MHTIRKLEISYDLDYSTRKCCNCFEHYKEYSKYSIRTSNAYFDICMYVGFTHIHRAIYKSTYTVTYLPTYICTNTYFPTHTLMASYVPTYTSIIIQIDLHIKIQTPTHSHMKLHTLLLYRFTFPYIHTSIATLSHVCAETYTLAGSSDLTHLFVL